MALLFFSDASEVVYLPKIRCSSVALVDQAPDAGLLLGGADDLLLAHAAHQVGVLVAEARVLQRLLAAQALVALRAR